MIRHYKTDSLNKGQLRMAKIPQADVVYETPGLWVPLVKTKNVMILPGVPLLFKRMVDNWFEKELAEYTKRGDFIISPRTRFSVKTFWKESDLAEKLTQLQVLAKKFDIALGSYPKLFDDGSTFVVISISGPLNLKDEIQNITNEIIKSFDGEIFNQ
jgi:molybdopterin-biosynthesis enzyme MoeA-like protein